MILRPGPERAVSFTDDTSPDTRNTKKRHVSIHAKVRKENPLDWYYDLIRPFRHSSGELKSAKVLLVYLALTPQARVKLWDTLKEVQINITDSLPYVERTKELAKETFKRDDAIDYIRQRAIANDPLGKMMLEKLNNHAAESILLDAPSRTFSFLHSYAKEHPMGGYGLGRYIRGVGEFRPPKHEIPLERFQSNGRSIVRTVTEWTSKSASVFSDAIDKIPFEGFLHSHPMLDPSYRALRKSHAFDRGNKKLVDLTDDERRDVARRMQYHSYWQEEEYPFEPLYGDVDSGESFYIQASDIAAGIAKHLFETGGIIAVTKHFEYVMFNGKRTSLEDAHETILKWRNLGYFN